MKAEEIEQVGPELKRLLGEFAECFGRREPAEHARIYVCGQLSDLPRKSVEPMADLAGIDPRALQKFLARHKWDDELMVKQLHRIIARDHADPNAIGIIDETSFPKKGTKTPGVQRQHCGASGKQDNCTITVHLGYAASHFHCLVSSALFLPESWSADRERCREAGIPDHLAHRTKWRIALELHQQARENGVRLEWLTADEHYGRPVEFHLELSRRAQKYVVEVPANFWGWCQKPQVVSGRRGLHRKDHPPISSVADLAAYSKKFAGQDWRRFHIKDGAKGPIVWEAKAAPIYLKDNDALPAGAHWLIVARNTLNPAEIKYFVSNAPQDTPLEALLFVAFSRWHVERCFEDNKTELGMDHFEVRSYGAMLRHLALTAVSYLFVARLHQALKKNSGLDGLSGAHSRQCLPQRQGQARQARVSGARLGDPHADSTTQRQSGAQPSQAEHAPSEKTRHSPFVLAAL